MSTNGDKMDNDVKLASKIKKRLTQKPVQQVDFEALVAHTNDGANRIGTRRFLVEPPDRDPNGLERVLGQSDLCSINYLSRGVDTARAVARIRVREVDGAGEWYGTGFLVAPNLLLTNNHVLPNRDSAALAIAEFNVEHDRFGVETQMQVYNIISNVFYTDSSLDFTFVKLAPRSFSGMPLSEYGYLPLIPNSGKAIDSEWVSMIQHPGGQPKQIAIRDSRIVILEQEDVGSIDLDSFIHYTADSEPGSSGAPVLNDQWQVVALHHRAVPNYDKNGNILTRDGKRLWQSEMGDSERGWVANEGVRVSAIINAVAKRRFENSDAAQIYQQLQLSLARGKREMLSAAGFGAADGEFEAQGKPSMPPHFSGRDGYDPNFLSKAINLPRDTTRQKYHATLGKSKNTKLDYRHFSILFDNERRFARFTAVNIDGTSLARNEKVKTQWRQDGRIDLDIQCDDNLYSTKGPKEVVYFQRGHLVRRVDPSWGPDAEEAVKDTFHFTNAAPHVAAFNNTIWGNLEDYLLQKCDSQRKRMTVFSGPIFGKNDPDNYGLKRTGGPYQIPLQYWKVAVIQKTSKTIAAAAFIVSHGDLLNALVGKEDVFAGLQPYTPEELVDNGIQVPIKQVEEDTGLRFGLNKYDSVEGLEATGQTRPLRSFSDIVI